MASKDIGNAVAAFMTGLTQQSIARKERTQEEEKWRAYYDLAVNQNLRAEKNQQDQMAMEQRRFSLQQYGDKMAMEAAMRQERFQKEKFEWEKTQDAARTAIMQQNANRMGAGGGRGGKPNPFGMSDEEMIALRSGLTADQVKQAQMVINDPNATPEQKQGAQKTLVQVMQGEPLASEKRGVDPDKIRASVDDIEKQYGQRDEMGNFVRDNLGNVVITDPLIGHVRDRKRDEWLGTQGIDPVADRKAVDDAARQAQRQAQADAPPKNKNWGDVWSGFSDNPEATPLKDLGNSIGNAFQSIGSIMPQGSVGVGGAAIPQVFRFKSPQNGEIITVTDPAQADNYRRFGVEEVK